MSADPAAQYRAIHEGVGGRFEQRDFLSVKGPDALSWLQGQLSQDVEALSVGASAESLLLTPQGKVVAYLRAARTSEREIVLDTEAGWGHAALDRLNSFKLRVKADVGPLAWSCLSLRGPGAADAAGERAADSFAIPVRWPGFSGVDLLGPRPEAVGAWAPVGEEVWEAARIEAGLPAMGKEVTERTIPVEAGLVARAVSLTKGCYTGQELVARLDARGNRVPRLLRGLYLDRPAPAGAELHIAGKAVGSVTSVATSPANGVVALGYLRREASMPSEVEVRWEAGQGVGRAVELPLVEG